MTTEAKFAPSDNKFGTDFAKSGAKPPYPFRTGVSLVLLALNILVAGIYFHLINP